MAGEAQRIPSISYAEYLALEQREDARFEWFEGQVYAMAGGTLAHAELAAAIGAELRALALSCGRRMFSADAKVRVLATGLATYPDGPVVCGAIERDPDDDNALTNPALLVEVLSEGTERFELTRGSAHDRRAPRAT